MESVEAHKHPEQVWSTNLSKQLATECHERSTRTALPKCTPSSWSRQPVNSPQLSPVIHWLRCLRPNVSLFCLVVLCAVTLPAHSANCLVIEPERGNALNNYDLRNTHKQDQHAVEHRTRAWKGESGLQDTYLDSQNEPLLVVDKEEDEDGMGEDVEEDMAEEAGHAVSPNVPKPTCDENNKICSDVAGVMAFSMNLKANPCEDFYEYVCGNWMLDHPVPVYVKSWSHFQRLFYDIRKDLIETLNSREKFGNATGNRTVFTKLFDFFHGCKNEKQRDATGYTPLLKKVADLGGWPMIDDNWDQDKFRWEDAYIQLTKLNLFFFLTIEPMTDLLDTSKTVLKIGPPYRTKENIVNMGIFQMHHRKPEFSYSFEGRRASVAPTNPDSQTDKVTAKYKEVIIELKVHSLVDPNQLNTSEYNQVLDTQLNEIYTLQDELQKSANPMRPIESYQANYTDFLKDLSEIQNLVRFNITMLVKEMFGITLTETQKLFVPDIDYLKRLDVLLHEYPKSILANYFATNMVMNLAPHTTTKMVSLLITKIDPTQADAKDILQNICFEQTSTYLPELLGKLYLEGVINVTTKWQQDVSDLVARLNQSFHQLLTESKWMDESTIKEAIDKLDSMSMNVGYPSWYADETQFEQYCAMFNNISREDFFSSVMTVSEASQELSMQELSTGLHYSALTSWPGHRQIIDVNAFYYFTTNGIYIPVAIARYPFYEQDLPKAITFGSMGMIIGHEMTHAFDITGRLYDYQGALRNWWSEQTADSFRNKTDCFVKQYSNYVMNSIRIDGERTLAENIADNGGLREAYRAYKIYQSENGADSQEGLPGVMSQFTTDQLFFISFANMWCTSNMVPGDLESDIQKNAHSPPNIRVLATLANFNKFAEAFNCKTGSKMNPEEKCILW